MVLKTFNVDKEAYEKYSKHCKENGVSMSKQVENFIKQEIEKIVGKREINEIKKDMETDIHPLSKYC